MVGKWPFIPSIDEGPILSLPIINSQLFYGSQKYERQEVERVKVPRKRTGKGQDKNSQRPEKSTNFGLCACAKLKYCQYIFIPNLFGKKKISFVCKTKALFSDMAAKTLI